jgi:hypothetical protein
MPQAETLTTKQGLAAHAQLVDLRSIKGVQGTGYRRLIGKATTPPRSGQGEVWPQSAVYL